MIDNTINDSKTIVGGGKDVILAGRYHILHQLGVGGMETILCTMKKRGAKMEKIRTGKQRNYRITTAVVAIFLMSLTVHASSIKNRVGG